MISAVLFSDIASSPAREVVIFNYGTDDDEEKKHCGKYSGSNKNLFEIYKNNIVI